MCFEFDALPPELPAGRAVIAGGAAAESLTVTAADGNEFAAALAESPAPSGPGVVILPDVRGLYRFYVELAERFAAAGHHAIAFDYFGRTAGTAERGEDFDYKPHVDQTTIAGDAGRPQSCARGARRAHRLDAVRQRRLLLRRRPLVLGRGQPGPRARRRGRLLRRAQPGAAWDPNRPNWSRTPTRSSCRCSGSSARPTSIPAEDRAAFDTGLERAGVEHEIVSYPGAPHSFFDRKQEEFAEASTDAWTRVLDFLATEPARRRGRR